MKNLFITIFSILYCVTLPASAITRVKIDGEIFRFDNIKNSNDLERQILYRLAIQEARRQKLEQNPEVRKELDQVLYRHFLVRSVQQKKADLVPSKEQIKAAYEKHPLVRLRLLSLYTQTETQKNQAKKQIAEIEKRLKRGDKFAELVLAYSQDGSAQFAGDLDFKGVHQLPPQFYERALKLKPKQISMRFASDQAIHWIELLEKKPYAESVKASYLAYLGNEIKKANEQRHLKSILAELKKKSSIEVLDKNPT